MECNVCLNEWDEQKCVPRMLPCGHSYCGDCLSLLFKPSSQDLSCPKCMLLHKLDSLKSLEKAFPKNWALIALADSHKPTAPLLQMRMGTPQKSRTNLKSKLFQSLSSSGGLQVVYTSRTRGNSDNLLSNSSTFISALSGSMRRGGEDAIDEEYKSEDEMRRVLSETSEEESCQEDQTIVKARRQMRGAKKGKPRHDDSSHTSDYSDQPNHHSDHSDQAMQHKVDGNHEEDQEEPFLEPGATCNAHNLKVHSWNKNTRQLLCTMCIQGANLSNEQVQVFAQAVREIKTRMLEAKELNKLRKMQLTQVMSHLTEAQRKNRLQAEHKLSTHLKSVRKLMDDYEMSCKMQLTQAFKKQDLNIGSIEQRVGEDLDQLCNDDISLQSMFDHDELLLVYMTQAVDNLYTKTVNFRPRIDNFDDLVVNVDIKPDATALLKQALSETHAVQLDTLRDTDSQGKPLSPSAAQALAAASMSKKQEDVFQVASDAIILSQQKQIIVDEIQKERQPPVTTIDSLFLRDEHWLCTTCGQRLDGTEAICVKCLKFKPIIFYPNLAHSPADVTTKELKAIHRRRKLERKLVIEAEKAGQNLQAQSTVWFIISNKWLYKWKCFIQNQVTLNNFFDNEEWAASITLSNNSEVGVLPPGLISNEEDLFAEADTSALDQDFVVIPGKALKKDLRVNINYRAVNPFVWYFFFVNYGGMAGSTQAPCLPRESIDIYSRDMSKLIKIYWGAGQVLPVNKMTILQNLGKDVVQRYFKKKSKKGSKDGSAQSKRHREVKLAQSSNLLVNDVDDQSSALGAQSCRSEVQINKNSSQLLSKKPQQSSGLMSKLKMCTLQRPQPSAMSQSMYQKNRGPISSFSGALLGRQPTTTYSQIEQLLSDDKNLQFNDI